jgi:protein transport protein SEC24
MRFVDQGRHFICNLCGFRNDTPRDYMCNLGPDGRRRDADDRPELCRGTVEFVATKEFLVRDPMPAVYFFLIDVSMNAIETGATAAACSAIAQAISDLPMIVFTLHSRQAHSQEFVSMYPYGVNIIVQRPKTSEHT